MSVATEPATVVQAVPDSTRGHDPGPGARIVDPPSRFQCRGPQDGATQTPRSSQGSPGEKADVTPVQGFQLPKPRSSRGLCCCVIAPSVIGASVLP
jgi:hypothetical protein